VTGRPKLIRFVCTITVLSAVVLRPLRPPHGSPFPTGVISANYANRPINASDVIASRYAFLEVSPELILFRGMAFGFAAAAPISGWRARREPLDAIASFEGFEG
jgi:hypothetical protein